MDDADFEWDDSKRWSNLEKHGVDFLRAALAFDGKAAILAFSPRGSEGRWKITAEIDGQPDHRDMDLAWRIPDGIISARKARHDEDRKYRQIFS